jgi:hypothetical protein
MRRQASVLEQASDEVTGTTLDGRRSMMQREEMPTEVQAPVPVSRLGPIRAPQNFFAGLALVAIAAFAIWATSDGVSGLALAISAFFSDGDPLRLADFTALVAFAVLLVVALIVARVVSAAFYGGTQVSGVFFYAAIVLIYGTILVMFAALLRRNAWVESLGLRGPFFVVAGILSFAITIRLFGLMVAGPLAMIIGGYASHEVRIREIIIFAVVMTAFCVGLFRYILNLPIPILNLPGIIYI